MFHLQRVTVRAAITADTATAEADTTEAAEGAVMVAAADTDNIDKAGKVC